MNELQSVLLGLLCFAGTIRFSFCYLPTTAGPVAYGKGYGPGEQEWGYIDVREGAHMFYWLFYVQNENVSSYYDRPLVIWLQGGPGASSTGFGNFEEIGPLFLNGTKRPTSWANHVNVLFIDNPVGAGFSYVDNENLLTTNNTQIGSDMVSFLRQFYEKFPKFEKVPLYIYSESYGGKMAVEIARQLHKAVQMNKLTSNFKGVGLIDSWISPVDSVNTWAPFLFYMGMVDEKSYEKIHKAAKLVENAVDKGEFKKATQLWSDAEMRIIAETNNIDFYNILYKAEGDQMKNREDMSMTRNFDEKELQKLMEGPVKKALQIPENVVHNKQSRMVFAALSGDFMKPVVHVVEDLLNNTNLEIVVMTGNLDLIVDTPGTVHWMNKMKWKGANVWKTAPRRPYILNKYIEGYVKTVDNLHMYWVTRSGHMIPSDNPETALKILRDRTGLNKSKY